MKRVFHFIVVSALAAEALVLGQGGDANKILADVREALGGDKKLAAVTSVTVNGRATRVTGETSSPPTDFEMAMVLPDKYMKKEVVAVLGPTTLARTSGFNGAELIEAMDAPPSMGGGMIMRMGGPGPMGAQQTPEQQAAARKISLLANRQEFARLTLGMFATSFKGYPLTFTSAGQAESPDGKADVIEVKGEGDFAAKLFIDAKTHLPLMLSWMAKEPLRMNMSSGGGSAGSGGGNRVMAGGGGAVMQTFSGGGGGMTPEQRDQLMKDLDQRMKEAEAQRRTVEYRIYYGEYQDVGGVKMPAHIQRSIDGQPADELALEKIKINQKVDLKKFETVK